MPNHLSAETLTIEGPDAIGFAQAQLSSNVATLPVGAWQFSAWLDPQGRVRHLIQLARVADQTLLLLLRGGSATELGDALKRFVFRSKVTIHAHAAATIQTGPAMTSHTVSTQDVTAFGCGQYSMLLGTSSPDDEWRAHQVNDGWPWLSEDTASQFVPQALSLERLGGVALDKGCYPGQEIVARLHFRGGNKRHMHCVVLSQHPGERTVLHRNSDELASLLDVASVDDRIHALVVMHDAHFSNAGEEISFETDEGITLTCVQRFDD